MSDSYVPRRPPSREAAAPVHTHPAASRRPRTTSRRRPGGEPAGTHRGIGQRIVRRLQFAWRTSIPFRILVLVVALSLVALAFSLRPQAEPTPGAQPMPQAGGTIIEPAAAVEMAIPRLGLTAEFSSEPCHLKNGAIDPKELSKACTYTAVDKPYAEPSSNAQDVVVIAGHTAGGVPAVFNKLYDGKDNQHNVQIGDKLYLRTAASASKWLEYTATDLHDPGKEGLSTDPAIWGTGAQPGRLLTISCIQPANPLASSVRNAVVGWQFESVVDQPAAST